MMSESNRNTADNAVRAWLQGQLAPGSELLHRSTVVESLLRDRTEVDAQTILSSEQPTPEHLGLLNAVIQHAYSVSSSQRLGWKQGGMAEEPRDIESLYRLICRRMDEKHLATREVVRQESAQLKRDLVQSIKASPLESVELLGKLLFIGGSFSLLVTGISGFNIFNPAFAMLSVFTAVAAYGMARIRRKSLQKES